MTNATTEYTEDYKTQYKSLSISIKSKEFLVYPGMMKKGMDRKYLLLFQSFFMVVNFYQETKR
jgi:hypothetical protein